MESFNDGILVTWDWKRYPATDQEIVEAVECQRLICGTRFSQADDSWVWNVGDSKEYVVREVKEWIKGSGSQEGNQQFDWCKWIPSKCNIFMWRALLDRIPTKCALRRRNIAVGSWSCVFL
ncbi:putative reverse transcriptase zinc-binding domain-containing protein [Helianthus annuus]|nr:putative reverse transcriptase zinc-binding domain-containing protein [Helianthus annuus]